MAAGGTLHHEDRQTDSLDRQQRSLPPAPVFLPGLRKPLDCSVISHPNKGTNFSAGHFRYLFSLNSRVVLHITNKNRTNRLIEKKNIIRNPLNTQSNAREDSEG